MRFWLVLSLVVLLMVLSLAAYAQPRPPGAGGPPGAPPGGPGGGMWPGGFGMPMSPPVVMTFEGFIYVVLGNVIYKVDPKEVKVVGAAFLMPPGMAFPGGPPPPHPPGF